MKIAKIKAREILDSNGHPTVEAEVWLENGICAVGQTPAGSSRGDSEAVELRDGDPLRYQGLGVLRAVENIQGPIEKALCGLSCLDQRAVDRCLIELDGTANKSKLGANAILSVSLAVCRVAAVSQNIPLYRYIGQLAGQNSFQLPQPRILVMEGGKHGNWATDIQEFMVMPYQKVFGDFAEMLRAGVEIYQHLGNVLGEKNYSLGVGMEGAYCPREIESNEEALNLVVEAISRAGYEPGKEVGLALDVAASEFSDGQTYVLKSEDLTFQSTQWFQQLLKWAKQYPISSLEDPLDQDDWDGWSEFLTQVGDQLELVGDDLLTTHPNRIMKAQELHAVRGVLIKPNQVGTVTETLEAIRTSQKAGFSHIISHRAGETQDDFIADLSVGTSASSCKFGGPIRGERVVKYNRLLKIEQEIRES